MVCMERVGRCGSTTPLLMEIEEVDENKVWYHTINSKQISFKIVFVGWQYSQWMPIINNNHQPPHLNSGKRLFTFDRKHCPQ